VVPTVTLSGPTRVLPESTSIYRLEVVAGGDQRFAGLNVSSDTGVLGIDLDPSVQLMARPDTGRLEVTHLHPKALNELELASFEFSWTAPADLTSALLTGWGNAVDGQGNTLGDRGAMATLPITRCPDDDGDGHSAASCGGDDCDDLEAAVCPGALEAPDQLDNDCDGTVDEGTEVYDDDGDGWSEADHDCDDAAPEVYPDAEEVCGDGIDQDCSGEDLTCGPGVGEVEPEGGSSGPDTGPTPGGCGCNVGSGQPRGVRGRGGWFVALAALGTRRGTSRARPRK